MKKTIFSILILLSVFQINAQNYLQQCIDKQLKKSEKYFVLKYTENRNNMVHGMSHWSTRNLNIKGELTLYNNGKFFLQIDSLVWNNENLGRKIQYSKNYLLLKDYGKEDWQDINRSQYNRLIIETLRYNPAYLLNYLFENNTVVETPYLENDSYIIYKTQIGKTEIQFSILKSNSLIDKVRVKSDYVAGFGTSLGDVEDIYTYSGYIQEKGFYFPSLVTIDKTNKHVSDEIRLESPTQETILPLLSLIPPDYSIKDDEIIEPEIETKKYSDHIYLINLAQKETTTMLVEFNDFFVAIEAPQSTKNGELIINEAKKINSDKPIKYFIAGHFHPHYLGGVRAFVHKGTTVLSIQDNYDYILEQVKNPHTITPDSLQIEPKSLKFESIDKSKPFIISDGTYEMQAIFTGDKSDHTFDYLVFYFPQEKLLYQGDLVFIPLTGEKTKLSKREMSCYNVVKDHNLKVDTILQAWPIRENGVKWLFPFSELEEIADKQIETK